MLTTEQVCCGSSTSNLTDPSSSVQISSAWNELKMQNQLLIATGHWMRSGDGIATVQWASAVLSVVAIGTALYAFLAGQKRALAERINEATRERLVLERTEQERVF